MMAVESEMRYLFYVFVTSILLGPVLIYWKDTGQGPTSSAHILLEASVMALCVTCGIALSRFVIRRGSAKEEKEDKH